jgi:hypothetical protein
VEYFGLPSVLEIDYKPFHVTSTGQLKWRAAQRQHMPAHIQMNVDLASYQRLVNARDFVFLKHFSRYF